jgi:type II secretory pathway predicted ATPase ExeA
MSILAGRARTAVAVGEVFVDGGQPHFTYVPRSDRNLETTVQEYQADGGCFLAITGPTKTGKTVLIRKVLPSNHLMVDGGQIKTSQDFFERLARRLNLPDNRSKGRTTTVGGSVKLPLPIVRGLKVHGDHESETTAEYKFSKFDVLDVLAENGRMLVIDDFHLIPPHTRTDVLQNLKSLVGTGLRVILLSVPHRGFDAVKAESDLQLRVQHFEIPPWASNELAEIAGKGFNLLGAVPDPGLVALLAANAYGNPQLMQLMCKQACRDCTLDSGWVGKNHPVALIDQRKFFQRVARKAIAQADLELILQARGRKKTRTNYLLKDGSQADVYMLTLRTVAELLPTTKLSSHAIFERAKSKLKKPGTLYENQISSALGRMSQAVASRPGERVLEWDVSSSYVHIVDPGLAFLIKWATP